MRKDQVPVGELVLLCYGIEFSCFLRKYGVFVYLKKISETLSRIGG